MGGPKIHWKIVNLKDGTYYQTFNSKGCFSIPHALPHLNATISLCIWTFFITLWNYSQMSIIFLLLRSLATQMSSNYSQIWLNHPMNHHFDTLQNSQRKKTLFLIVFIYSNLSFYVCKKVTLVSKILSHKFLCVSLLRFQVLGFITIYMTIWINLKMALECYKIVLPNFIFNFFLSQVIL